MTLKDDKKLTWAIIGGGNGGQSAAGHLGIMGFSVRLYDIIPETVMSLNEQGGIKVCGAVEGFGKIEFATVDIKRAVNGADIVMVIAPSLAHKTIARNLSPHLQDGQIVFLHPGSTFGAIEFRQGLDGQGCRADVIIAEANSLLYACRATKVGTANIGGIKQNLMVAAIPAEKTAEVVEKLNRAFPQIVAGKNVLETSLNNLNAVVHPAPSLLNASMIESQHEWLYYGDGITPTIGSFVEALDVERIELGKALGIKLKSVVAMYKDMYDVDADNLTEAVRSNRAYKGIKGQKRIDTRYILEDIPMGLVPMASLAKKLGLSSERMDTVCKLGSFLLQRDLISKGRTVENLGIENMTIEEIIDYITTGIRVS